MKEKTNAMLRREAYTMINNDFESLRPAEARPQDCQYYVGSEGRYCKATTNSDCRKCRFFNPNFRYRQTMLSDALKTMTDKCKELDERQKILEETVSGLNKELDDASILIARQSDRICYLENLVLRYEIMMEGYVDE